MNWAKALKGGLLAGINVTMLVLVLRTLHATSLNLERMLGSMVTKRVEVAPWFLGLAIFLLLATLFGLLYGALMERAGMRGTRIGMAIGAGHAVLSGLALPALSSQTGPFAIHLGAFTVAVFIGVHLVYGIIVGEIYQLKARPVIQDAPTRVASRRSETTRAPLN
jgi:hypothetical protein